MKATTKALLISVLGVLFVGTASVAVLSLQPHTEAYTAPQAAVIVEQLPTVAELFALVNEERAKVGVAPLVLDERLNQSAQFKTDDMLTRNYFGHNDPITGTHNGTQKGFELMGSECKSIGENLTDNSYVNDSKTAIQAFKDSPAHFKAMIDAKYASTGFGISGTKVAQHFCQP